ncbi:MAG: helix-turn-helix domain-containing protein [Planctomycetota bacterium]
MKTLVDPIMKAIRERVADGDVTQADISRESGLSHSQVSLTLSGRKAPSDRFLEGAMKACGIRASVRIETEKEIPISA